MILIDYSGVAIAALFANGLDKEDKVDENILRHIILSSLLSFKKKYSKQYGEMVLCMDAGEVWRRDEFAQYKASRKTKRTESKLDWNEIFDALNNISREIREFVPWKALKIHKCEADDIIAVLCKDAQSQFGAEQCLIISSDKDMKQLQRYWNVRQWSPNQGKFLDEKHPLQFLEDHILSGDKGDGVPNVYSDDDTFVEGKRQTVLTAKRKVEVLECIESGLWDDPKLKNNYERNRLMIDFESIPEEIQNKIREANETVEVPNGSQLMNYFIQKRCKQLMSSLQDFK